MSESTPDDVSWVVAIHTGADDLRPLGAGVLVAERLVLTARHVVARQDRPLYVAFPNDGDGHRRVVSAVRLADGGTDQIADVAVLDLADPAPEGVTPAPLRLPAARGLDGSRWWAFGFPETEVLGSAAEGRIGATLGYGWMRLDTDSRYVVEPGFSGSGLWSPEYGAVVGLIGQARSADRNAGDGRAMSLRQVNTWLPDLDLPRLARWTVNADRRTRDRWRGAARGTTAAGEPGHRFQGREAALGEIVGWLRRSRPDRRVLLVTAAPGGGKSAVLGRIITTADPRERAALPADDRAVRADLGSVACAVDVEGKKALDVALEIARSASATLPRHADETAAMLLAELRDGVHHGSHFNIVLDALDQADGPGEARSIVEDVLLPVLDSCAGLGVRIVLGARTEDEELLAALGRAAKIIDLDRPEYFDPGDLRAYVAQVLRLGSIEREDGPYRAVTAADPLVVGIAEAARPNFLVGGLMAYPHGLYDEVVADPAQIIFGARVDAALRRYLDPVPPVDGVPAAQVLAVLAFAESPGPSISLWAAGLRSWDLPVEEEALRRFTRSPAASFLIEDGGQAWAGKTYRLFHQALAAYLRTERRRRRDPAADHRDLARAWRAEGERGGWTDPHLLRHLAGYAAAGGILDQVLGDDVYLVRADLRRLGRHLGDARGARARDRARLIRLTPHAADAGPDERAAMFGVTAALERLPGITAVDADPPYRARWAVAPGRHELLMLSGHTGQVHGVCTLEVNGEPVLASGADDGTVRLWDLPSGTERATLTGHTGAVLAVRRVSSGGRDAVVSAGADGTVRLWEAVEGGTPAIVGRHRGAAHALAVAPGDIPLLLSAGVDGDVRLWDLTSASRGVLRCGGVVTALCAFRMGDVTVAALAAADRTIRLWDLERLRPIRTLPGHARAVRTLCVVPGPAGPLIASAGRDRAIRLWRPATGELAAELVGQSDTVNDLAVVTLETGATQLVSAGQDRTVRRWDPHGGQSEGRLGKHTDAVGALAVAHLHHREVVVAGGRDRTIRVWDPDVLETPSESPGHTDWVNGFCLLDTGDGTVLASASDDRTIRLWRPDSGDLVRVLVGHQGWVQAVCRLTIDGRDRLASAGRDRTVRIWDPGAGTVQRVLSGHEDEVNAVCAVPTPTGQLLASGGGDRVIRLWEPRSGREVARLTGHTGRINGLCAAESGGSVRLVSAARDGTIRLWDPGSGEPAGVLTGHDDWVNGLCVLRTGERTMLASASRDRTVRIWDLAEQTCVRVLPGHSSWVNGVTPVGSGQLLASTGGDHTVRVWAPSTGRCLAIIPVHYPASGCLALGRTIFVSLSAGVLAVDLAERFSVGGPDPAAVATTA